MIYWRTPAVLSIFTTTSLLILLQITASHASENNARSLSLGDTIPQISTFDIFGEMYNSQKALQTGNYLLISFFTTYCQPCVVEFAEFNQLLEMYPNRLEVVLVSVGQDSREDLKRFQMEQNIKQFRIIRDRYKVICKPYGVTDRVPVTVIVNTLGTVVHAQYGAFPEGQVKNILKPYLEESK